MSNLQSSCPECGALHPTSQTCRDDFDQMLFWEAEEPTLGQVHHLMVLCYHLQHPSLYSPEGLENGQQLLAGFLRQGLTPQAARRKNRDNVDSGKRAWKITARPGSHGAYPRPLSWTMTAADVVASGKEKYIESVQAWAKSVLEALEL